MNPCPTGHGRSGRCHESPARGVTACPLPCALNGHKPGWGGNSAGLSSSVLSRFPKAKEQQEEGRVWPVFAAGSPLPSLPPEQPLAAAGLPAQDAAADSPGEKETTVPVRADAAPPCGHSQPARTASRDHPGSRRASGPLSRLQGFHLYPPFPLGCGITGERGEKITHPPYGCSPLSSSLLPSQLSPFHSGFGEGSACMFCPGAEV